MRSYRTFYGLEIADTLHEFVPPADSTGQISKPSSIFRYNSNASSISLIMIYSSAVCEREERPGPIFTEGKGH